MAVIGDENANALPPSSSEKQRMVVKRHRFKQSQPLEQRLAQDTAQLREKAEALPPGGAREQIFRRITQNEAASDLCEMLRPPGLQPTNRS